MHSCTPAAVGLTVVVWRDGAEVFELPQIPQLDRVSSSSGQVVTVL